MKQWLERSSIDQTYLFDFIIYTEKTEWKKTTIPKFIANFLEENTVEQDFMDEISRIVNWDKDKVYQSFVTEFQPSTDSLRKGKLGEILHGEILIEFYDIDFPIKKYQYQLTPNTSLHGTDLIGFRLVDGKVESIFYVETKLRTNRDRQALPEAFQGIIKARDETIPSYLKFILKQLYKTDTNLFTKFLEYGMEISPTDHFRIGAIFEDSAWDKIYFDDLTAVYDRSISNLTVDVIKIKSLNELVKASYKELGVDIA